MVDIRRLLVFFSVQSMSLVNDYSCEEVAAVAVVITVLTVNSIVCLMFTPLTRPGLFCLDEPSEQVMFPIGRCKPIF